MFIISKPISNVKRGLSGIGNMIEQRHSDLYKKNKSIGNGTIVSKIKLFFLYF